MSLTILLADDHEIVRYGLRSLIEEQESDMTVVGEAQNGRMAVELALELKPNIVIMDISMPDLNGLDATRKIKKECPGIKVIALSMHHKIQLVREMLKAGVSGYVLKSEVSDDLIQAIDMAMAGGVYLSPQISGKVAEDYIQKLSDEKPSRAATQVLTPREREVLQLIAEGKSTKEVALHLGVTTKAIESTRRKIMNKLDMHNIADLTKYAIQEGLTSLDF
jgi:DNA-binding NarL/FixJ family response regulator